MNNFNTFNSEQNSNLDQNSFDSINFPFFIKVEDINSFSENENIYEGNEGNFNCNFSFNITKNIDISSSEPSNQQNSSGKELGNDCLIKIENLIEIGNYKKIFRVCRPNKQRGRLSKRKRNNTSRHDKYQKDNILRKIKVHSTNFIFELVNSILKIVGFEDIKFRSISYAVKSDVKYDKILSLKKMTIKELLCQKLSPKFKNKTNEDNEFIFESIKDNPIIKNLSDKKFLEIFKEIYCKKEKIINLKDYGSSVEHIITISEKIKIFKDLLEEEIDDYKYMKKLEEYVNNYFLKSDNQIIEEN